MISCILLAAGLSQRFGSPKALASLHQVTVIEHIQQTLLTSQCNEIIIVLGAYAEHIQPYVFNHKRIRTVYNKDYNLGQTSSVKTGVGVTHQSTNGLMFWPVDCPAIDSTTADTMIKHFTDHSANILIPTYHQKRGHPPIFNAHLKEKILNLPEDLGLNSFFNNYPPQTLEINDPGITKSFNTPEELAQIKKDAI